MITGAGRGIGEATARAFAAAGAAVAIAEKDVRTGQAVADDLERGGYRTLFVETDVTDEASIAAAVATATAVLGPIDVLVNNAGVNVFHPPLDTTDAEWARCMSIDLDGVWRMSRAILPGMRERGRGAIVNIASAHSFAIIRAAFPTRWPSTACSD